MEDSRKPIDANLAAQTILVATLGSDQGTQILAKFLEIDREKRRKIILRAMERNYGGEVKFNTDEVINHLERKVRKHLNIRPKS